MKPVPSIFLLLITTLVGCGEDTGRGRGEGGVVIPVNPEDAFVTASQMHRLKGTNVISSRDEILNISQNSLPAGYRNVPSMLIDDEGTPGVNVNTRSSLGRPTDNCGFANNISISERLTNCREVNGNKAIWNSSNGIAGESSWRLVYKVNTEEVWLDTRTGHIWSDIIASTNWCNASGNTSEETGATVNCKTEADAVTCVSKTVHNLNGVSWRLPTRNDYLQADLNGLRFVLKPTASSFWTATMNSQAAGRSEAWVYIQTQGTLEKALLTEDRQVRCIGAAVL